MSEQLKQELEADTDRLEAETVADSETIGEQEENEHYLEENKKLKEKLQEITNIVLPWYENE